MIPVLETRRWWERPLVNQSLKRLPKLLSGTNRIQVVLHPFSPGGKGRRRPVRAV
jgi:hypothetical protein